MHELRLYFIYHIMKKRTWICQAEPNSKSCLQVIHLGKFEPMIIINCSYLLLQYLNQISQSNITSEILLPQGSYKQLQILFSQSLEKIYKDQRSSLISCQIYTKKIQNKFAMSEQYIMVALAIFYLGLCASSMMIEQNWNPIYKFEHQSTLAQTRSINFSDYSWSVRGKNSEPQGPGPNYFSDQQTNVWLDQRSFLHIKISKQANKWLCSQVILDKSYGYGSYVFNIEKGFQLVDPRTVLGLFTYLDDNHQIDIQISRWGIPNNLNTQYVIQPSTIQGNLLRFSLANLNMSVINAFTWSNRQILFQSFYANTIAEVQSQIGKVSKSQRLVKQWVYTGKSIPQASTERARINLWLYQGKPPINQLQQYIVVKEFKFLPIASSKKQNFEDDLHFD